MTTATMSCELCPRTAMVYCGADQAFLCEQCDRKVHTANFIVSRHPRAALCRICGAHTGFTIHGGAGDHLVRCATQHGANAADLAIDAGAPRHRAELLCSACTAAHATAVAHVHEQRLLGVSECESWSCSSSESGSGAKSCRGNAGSSDEAIRAERSQRSESLSRATDTKRRWDRESGPPHGLKRHRRAEEASLVSAEATEAQSSPEDVLWPPRSSDGWPLNESAAGCGGGHQLQRQPWECAEPQRVPDTLTPVQRIDDLTGCLLRSTTRISSSTGSSSACSSRRSSASNCSSVLLGPTHAFQGLSNDLTVSRERDSNDCVRLREQQRQRPDPVERNQPDGSHSGSSFRRAGFVGASAAHCTLRASAATQTDANRRNPTSATAQGTEIRGAGNQTEQRTSMATAISQASGARLQQVLHVWTKELGPLEQSTGGLAMHMFVRAIWLARTQPLQAGLASSPQALRTTLAACLWAAAKLVEQRTDVPGAADVASVSGVAACELKRAELKLLTLLKWRPLEGWTKEEGDLSGMKSGGES